MSFIWLAAAGSGNCATGCSKSATGFNKSLKILVSSSQYYGDVFDART
jgi:hypothetical protein